MKKFRKVLALVMAAAMLFALAVTASAAADGSITIQNTVKDEEYSLYKIFGLTYAGGTDASTDPLKITYTYTKTAATDPFYTAMDESGLFVFTETTDPLKFTVTTATGVSGEDISAFFQTNESLLPTPVDTITGDGTTQTKTGLEYGYYYIDTATGALKTIDSTAKDAVVVDKNQVPSWPDNDDPTDDTKPHGKDIIEDGKYLVANDAAFGDTVNFQITVEAKNAEGSKYVTEYTITDTLGAGFQYNNDAVVKVAGAAPATGTSTVTFDSTTNTLTVVLDWYDETAGGSKVIEGETVDPVGASRYAAESTITVNYSATLLSTAVVEGSGNPNTAKFTYDVDEKPWDEEDPEPTDEDPGTKETTTYTFDVAIFKYTDTDTPLAGATFHFYSDAACTTPVLLSTTDNVLYSYDKTSGSDQEIVTGNTGLFTIQGLDSGKYYLKETDAPFGYNLLEEPIEIVIDPVEDGALPAELPGQIDVENTTGTLLPSTGGVGTTLLIVFGAMLFLCTAMVLVTKKRMYNEG